MTYRPDSARYDGSMRYRRSGRSGLDLPLLSLGFWHNFGDDKPYTLQRDIALRAFDLGITHFDLANNYGPPYGSAEINAGRLFSSDLKPYRDELVISSKAGYDMWAGPYGQGGGGRKYLLSSLDQSLGRLGLDYVDIFYSHRFDPTTPLEETASALASAVQQGKALYVGISSYTSAESRTMAGLLRELGTPLLIHQPSYSMLNRWIEDDGLLDTAADEGFGVIGFSTLQQGLLTNKYLTGIPEGSRATQGKSLDAGIITGELQARLRRMADGALSRPSRRVEPEALGYPLMAFVTVSLSQRMRAEATEALKAVPEIVELMATTGDGDMLAQVVVRDTADLNRVTEALLDMPGIVRTSTSIVLKKVWSLRMDPLLERLAQGH